MDLIDRQALLDRLANQKEIFMVDREAFWGEVATMNICADIVRKMPTVEPKRGEWVEVDLTGYADENDIHCGLCFRPVTEKTNFCPNCGADMRPREQEE